MRILRATLAALVVTIGIMAVVLGVKYMYDYISYFVIAPISFVIVFTNYYIWDLRNN